jgi:hypothetical protein
MNTKNTLVVGLLSILIIILIVLILKNNSESFKTYDLSAGRYAVLQASKAGTGKYPSSHSLSWVSASTMEDPVLSKVFHEMYRRDCAPPMISNMPLYKYHLPKDNQSMPKSDN